MLQAWSLTALVVVTPVSAVEPSSAALQEIHQLLDVLGNSNCQFNRNGEWYTPAEAVKHLNKKFDVLVGKGKIGTTEDFIRIAASESSVSGEPYQVQCSGAPAVNSGPWLTDALAKIRSGNKPL
ncbi:MAG TPA: hypothetical protein DCS87_01710 [Rheinheimera sp.]|nr:hypothetical protein [Rheinheimera sp.]